MANVTVCNKCGAPTAPFVRESNRTVEVKVIGRDQLCRMCVLEEVMELLNHGDNGGPPPYTKEALPCRI